MEAASSTGLMAGFFAFFFLFVLRPAASWVGLLDNPDHRKLHNGAVPLIGGLSVFLGVLLAWVIWMPMAGPHGLFIICAAVLVMVGAADDALDLPAKFRLGVQVVLGGVLTLGSGFSLSTFGNLLGFGEVGLGPLGPFITIAAVIGATNAFNMVDGIDGLAGSLSLVTLGSLAILFAAPAGFMHELALTLGIACALVPYLMANLRIAPFRRRIFMGDAGSMFIGFAVVWLLVSATQPGEMIMRPVTALWITAIPLMDMVAFMFAAIGLLGEVFAVPEWLMFGAFLALFALYDWSLSHIWRLLVVFRRRASHR